MVEEEEICTTLTLKCGLCKFETGKYGSEWRTHLLEESHQEKAREQVKWMSIKTKRRSVVIFGVKRISPAALLKYLGDLELVTEFVFWKERKDLCILSVLNTKFREFLIRYSHILQNEKLFFRSLDEIPDVEWISICPFAAVPDEVEIINDSGRINATFNESSDDDTRQEERDRTIEIGSNSALNDNGSLRSRGETVAVPRPLGHTRIKVEKEDIPPPPEYPSSSLAQGWDPDPTRMGSEDIVTNGVVNTGDKAQAGNGTNVVTPREVTAKKQVERSRSNKRVPPSNTEKTSESEESGSDADQHFDPKKALNTSMEAFYDRNLMPIDLWNLRQHIGKWIQEVLSHEFPMCEVIPFGMSGAAISTGHDDFNIFVDVEGLVNSEKKNIVIKTDLARSTEIGCKIMSILEKPAYAETIHGLETSGDKIIFTFVHLPSGSSVTCNLQVTNFLAMQCCRLVQFMCKLDDRVRPLLIVARHWSYHTRLVMSNPGIQDKKRKGCFEPSSIQMLVISFLINKKILPTVEELQLACTSSLIHGGINIAFNGDANKLRWKKDSNFEVVNGNPSAQCIVTLAFEMFAYYGKNASRVIISPFVGQYLSKRRLQNQPEESQRLFHSPASWNQTLSLASAPGWITVQHPLKLSINMTAHVSPKMVKMFRQQCEFTSDLLKTLLSSPSCFRDPAMVLGTRKSNTRNLNVTPAAAEGRFIEPEHHHRHQNSDTPTAVSHSDLNQSQQPVTVEMEHRGNQGRLHRDLIKATVSDLCSSPSTRNTDSILPKRDRNNSESSDSPNKSTSRHDKGVLKQKNFKIELTVGSQIKTFAKQKKIPMEGIKSYWIGLWEGFNYAAWNDCFGFMLFRNPEGEPDPSIQAGWRSIFPGFKAVLLNENEDKLQWAMQTKQKKKVIYLDALKNNLERGITSPDHVLQDWNNVEGVFSFTCHVYAYENSSSTIVMNCSNVWSTKGLKIAQNLKKRIRSCYIDLWNDYAHKSIVEKFDVLKESKSERKRGTKRRYPSDDKGTSRPVRRPRRS